MEEPVMNKLEEIISENEEGTKYIDFSKLPSKQEIRKRGYNFIDEEEYIRNTANYLSCFMLGNGNYVDGFIPKRNFKEEYENLNEINKMIPENSVKPIALVYNNSISKNYIGGYITKTNSKTKNLRDYINEGLKGKNNLNYDNIINIKNQIQNIAEKLKSSKMYYRLPIGTFNLDNLYIDEENRVILLNVNYQLTFNEKGTYLHDKDIKKTIRYLDKVENNNLKRPKL